MKARIFIKKVLAKFCQSSIILTFLLIQDTHTIESNLFTEENQISSFIEKNGKGAIVTHLC